MKLGVIIPNWDGADLLAAAVTSLRQQSIPVTVIVVDNGSVDESVQIIERDFPDVVLLKNSENLGFSGGVNTGLRYALKQDFDALGLFNNDATADTDWAKRLSEVLETDQGVGIVTGKLLRIDGNHLDSTGEQYSVWGVPFPRGRNQRDEGQFDDQTDIFGATGGATFYRATMLREIGLFDERFFAYYEDGDISFRSRLAGWQVRYVPAARAFHHISATSSKLGTFVRYHAIKNIVMLYLKNMPGWLFWKYLPLFSLWLLRLAVSSMLKGNGWVFARSMSQIIVNFPGLLRDRRIIQRKRRVSPREIDRQLSHCLPPKEPVAPKDMDRA